MRAGFSARHAFRERLERRALLSAGEPAETPPRDALPERRPPLGEQHARRERAWPDLLNPQPMVSLDEAQLTAALRFSFIAEDDSGAVQAALDAAPIAASTFDPACYFRELFVEELRRSTMQVVRDGKPVRVHEAYVLRVLSQPPADRAAVEQRTAIFAELIAEPPLRRAVELVHESLHGLFRLLRGEGSLGIRGEQARRRVEILKRIHALVEALAAEPIRAAHSALDRLHTYASELQGSAGFALLRDLVAYERERAFADLTVQLGADGTIRALKLKGLRELEQSRFHEPLVAQWLGQLWLWLKGYKITEGEVLDRWLDQVFDGMAHALPAFVQLMGDLDVIMSGLAFYDGCRARGLPTCFAEFAADDAPGALERVYNPLLFASGITPVSCDVALGARGVTTLVTGPNSGGKTRLLQALGVLQLLAQAGFPVPAAEARVRNVPGIFASLTQATSAEQPEGRLGTELLRIRMLFERAALGSLLLVDELCSGTSPSEGEELFRLVLDLLAELRSTSFVSTHFLKFAAELARGSGSELALEFVQVELDAEERPTHRFVPGVATTSLAQKTAARLGVTRDELRALVADKTPR